MSRTVTSLTNPTVKSVRGLHLRKERDASGLFDMRAFAADFAALLGEMARRHRAGLPPAPIG